MAGSKNCTANRGSTLKVACPKCASSAQHVQVRGHGTQTGKFLRCTSCDWRIKYKAGDYTKYEHSFVKGK